MATNEWRAPSIAERPPQTGLLARLAMRLEEQFDHERDQLPLWLPVGLGLAEGRSPFLARSGGLAITLGEHPRIATVADRVGRHPWAAFH